MNEVQTALARRIFDRAVSKAQDAVFLYTPKDKPLALSFGPNHIDTASYFIHLSFDGTELEISSEDPQQFLLLMDNCGSSQKVRLVLYLGDDPNPALEYDSRRPNQVLEGEILIQVQDEGAHVVTIFAGFDPADNSEPSNAFIIDGTRAMYTHFQKYLASIEVRF